MYMNVYSYVCIYLTILDFLQCMKQFERKGSRKNISDDHGTISTISIPTSTPEGANNVSQGGTRTEHLLSFIVIVIMLVLLFGLWVVCVAKRCIRYCKEHTKNTCVDIGGVPPEDETENFPRRRGEHIEEANALSGYLHVELEHVTAI